MAILPNDPFAFTEEGKRAVDEWSSKLIGAAIEVHRHLGPGLLENAYEECLCHELNLRGIPYLRQHPVDIDYKGRLVEAAYRIDILVAGLLVVELKSVDQLHPIFEAQLLTYLPLANRWLGLLLNFNVPVLKDGIIRRVR
jgi:GxxExxY protein